MIPPRERLIVALDVPNSREAQKIVHELGESTEFYKIGLQLFTAEGPAALRALTSAGRKIFLDLKLHDIPNTVASAIKSAAALGADMLTVHASGGLPMMKAAVEAARGAPKPVVILGVTILTSLDGPELNSLGVPGTVAEQTLRLAALARRAGCDGVVCSPHEVSILRQQLGNDLITVVPGVRPKGANSGDQARIDEPARAIRNGATYLVVGRPITMATDKRAAAEAIKKEIGSALEPSQFSSVS